MALLADFSDRLDLPGGPAWPVFGQPGLWMAAPAGVTLATDATGRPAFQLTLSRPADPSADLEPFATLDMTLIADAASGATLDQLRARVPGATLVPAPVAQSHLETVEPDDGAGVESLRFDMLWQAAGQARVAQHLAGGAIETMRARLAAGDGALFLTGALAIRGLSPRLGGIAVAGPELADAVRSVLATPGFTRDRIPPALATLPLRGLTGLDAVLAPASDGLLAEALADRLIDAWCAPADLPQDRAGVPAYQWLPDLAPQAWDLSLPLHVNRWVPLADTLASAGHNLSDPAFVTRHDLTAFPEGRHRITAFANIPVEVPDLHVLQVDLMAPANPPLRPAAAHAGGMVAPGGGGLELELQLALGEPLTFDVTGRAIVGQGADIRQLSGGMAAVSEATLVLAPEHFGMTVLQLTFAAPLLELAAPEVAISYGLDGAVADQILIAEGSSGLLVVPANATDGQMVVTIRERDGPGVVTLDPLPLSSLDVSLSLFSGYGPQDALLRCAAVAGGVVAVDVLPGLTGAEGQQTLAFTADQLERRFGYFSASPFAPGFRWRFLGAADWQVHPDPAVPLDLPDPGGA